MLKLCIVCVIALALCACASKRQPKLSYSGGIETTYKTQTNRQDQGGGQ